MHAPRPDEAILRANLYEEQRAASQDYFGDTIRYFFIIGSVIMLLTLPYFHRNLPVPFILTIAGIILMSTCAGLTNARWKWTIALDAIVAAAAVFVFESYAVTIYARPGHSLVLLFINQLLALLFFFALYFSIQTLRRWVTYR